MRGSANTCPFLDDRKKRSRGRPFRPGHRRGKRTQREIAKELGISQSLCVTD